MVLQTATKQILVFFSNRSGEKFNLVTSSLTAKKVKNRVGDFLISTFFNFFSL